MKMAARWIQILLALSFIIAGAAIGQTLFGTSSTANPQKPANTSNKPLAGQDFQKAVNSMGQQSQTQLMQQFKSQFNKGPSGNTMQSLPQLPGTSGSTPTPTPTAAPTPTATPSVQPKPITPTAAPVKPAPAPAPVAPPQQPADQTSVTAPSEPTQVYTGFAPPPKDSNSSDDNSSTGNQTSGGWNIQY